MLTLRAIGPTCWLTALFAAVSYGQEAQLALTQSVQQFGQQIGLALLDSLLQKGQEEVARSALQRQIELLEDINPPYAKLLKQIPPEMVIKAALAQRQQAAGPTPDTGDPFLNVLAKKGIVVNGGSAGAGSSGSALTANGSASSSQQQQLGNVFHAVLRNVLQVVQPSAVQNSLLGPQLPSQEVTNPLEPNANQLLIPQPSNGGLPSLPFLSGASGSETSGAAASLLPGALGSAVSPLALKTEAPEAPPNPFAPSVTKSNVDEPLPSPFDFDTEVAKISLSNGLQSRKKLVGKRHRVITSAPLVNVMEEDDKFEVPDNDRIELNNALTATKRFPDQRRLQQINSRAVKLLAYRKRQDQLPERTLPEVSRRAKVPAETLAAAVAATTVDPAYFTSRAATWLQHELALNRQNRPSPVSKPLVEQFSSPALNLRLQRLNSHTVLQGDSRLTALDENSGAWQPPSPTRGLIPSSALNRKRQRDLDVNGQINVPNDWLSGQRFLLDGSITGHNNNDIFSGLEF